MPAFTILAAFVPAVFAGHSRPVPATGSSDNQLPRFERSAALSSATLSRSAPVRTLAVALEALGHRVSHTVVAELLHEIGYSLQGNVKTREGRQHPDRDAQFRYIARQVRTAQRRGQPAISVDTKKKELVGPFKNGGPLGAAKPPERVRVHDFVIRGAAGGKAIPYGVYDLHRDEGWVSVGIDHDTATSPCGRFSGGGGRWAAPSIRTPRRC